MSLSKLFEGILAEFTEKNHIKQSKIKRSSAQIVKPQRQFGWSFKHIYQVFTFIRPILYSIHKFIVISFVALNIIKIHCFYIRKKFYRVIRNS